VVGETDVSVGATSFTVSVVLLTELPQVAVAVKVLVLSSSSALPPRMLPYVALVVSAAHEAKVEPEACAVSVETGTTVNATDAGGQEDEAVRLLDVMASVPFRSTLIAPVQATDCAT
jgi:hypothetical protein